MPMTSHNWIRICAEVFGLAGDLEIIVLGDSQRPAVAPLFRSQGHGGRLELIGGSHLFEATDFVYSEDSDIDSLAAAIVRSALPVRLERIPADSPLPAALARAYRGRGLVLSRPTIGCPWLALDPTWADPGQHLGRHGRQNLRRARRIAEGIGSVSSEILAPTPDELGPALREAYTVEAASWKGQEGSALAANRPLGEFYRRYARAAAEQGILRLCLLRIGGRAAAMQIAVEAGQRFWLLKIGYSAEFARCSPGTLLVAETIRHAALEGLRSFEFLGVDEPWIRGWRPLVRPCVSLRAYPFSIRGAWALARDVATVTPSEARALFRRGR